MDEYWDGGGYPEGLRRNQIPVHARIVGLAQVAEIFWGLHGADAAMQVVDERRGRWFDPELAKAFCALGAGDRLWEQVSSL